MREEDFSWLFLGYGLLNHHSTFPTSPTSSQQPDMVYGHRTNSFILALLLSRFQSQPYLRSYHSAVGRASLVTGPLC